MTPGAPDARGELHQIAAVAPQPIELHESPPALEGTIIHHATGARRARPRSPGLSHRTFRSILPSTAKAALNGVQGGR